MNEGGESFATSGTAGERYYGPFRGIRDDGRLYRVVISNDGYDAGTGATVTGGPLGVGVGRTVSKVLSVGSNVVLRFVSLAGIAWNDYGTVCQLSLTWAEEPGVNG